MYEVGLDINHPIQQTALICAVENDWLEGVELLIESGADVNKCNTSQQSALSMAGHDSEIGEMLIQAGADEDSEWCDE